MHPVPVVDLAGRYVGGEVILSWTFPAGAPDTVFVLPVVGTGSAKRAITNEMTERPLRNVSSGMRFAFQNRSTHDVTRCEFLVFLGPQGEPLPDFVNMFDNPAFTVCVTVGRAHVYYWINTKAVDAGFERHTLSLESSFSIEKGILGYSFSCGLQTFTVPFPDSIKRGKHKFPPFFVPHGSYIGVVAVDGSNAEVTSEVKKIYQFPFFW